MSELDIIENRYCPKCGAAFRAKASQPNPEITCTKCNNRVTLFIYPTDPPRAPGEQKPRNAGTYLFLIIAVVAGAAFIGLMALLSIAFGQMTVAVFASTLMLLLGLGMIIFAIERNSKVESLQTKLQNTDAIKLALIEGVDKWNGLEQSFQSIVRKEVDRLREEVDEEKRNLFAAQEEVLEHRDAVQTVAEKFVKDLTNWTMKNVTSRNFATSKTRIEKAIEFCRKKGAIVTDEAEKQIYADLREKFEDVVRKEAARAEQQRIKQQIREEQKAQAEMERELKMLQAQQAAIQQAIEEAMLRTQDEHSAEVEDLKQKLAEAEAKSARAMSMAQQTRSGYVYVISNIGSFGNDVFKIGMTRRLEPMDRVKELGDASVPFPFDVHMMISCDDAPTLEKTLHKKFHHHRMNKVNFRKEFFRVALDDIHAAVIENHGSVDYVAEPEALEYNEGINMDAEDQEFVEDILETYESDDDE